MRDAARKLLSVSWWRASKGGGSHSSPPAVAASPPGKRRYLRVALIGGGTLAAAVAVCTAGAYIAIDRLGPPDLKTTNEVSITVLDRRDRLLRAFTTPDGRWRLPFEATDFDQSSAARKSWWNTTPEIRSTRSL